MGREGEVREREERGRRVGEVRGRGGQRED